MRFLDRLTPKADEPKRFNLDALIEQVNYLGNTYPLGLQTSMTKPGEEPIEGSFEGHVRGAYKSNGPIFSCILARAMLFSEARFQWQRFEDGRPAELFGNQDLKLIEKPWVGGTTGELLWRAEQDASLAGNFYLYRVSSSRVRRMRPDWVTIVIGSNMDVEDPSHALDAEVIGYIYSPDGKRANAQVLLPDEVVHWAPIPDPLANFRGMSWLTPIVRDIESDQATTLHKKQFFNNAATPNLVVMPDASVEYEEFKDFKEDFEAEFAGAWNAYKTLFLGGGSSIQSVGLDFQQMEFKITQGAGETRIAAAAGVPPIVAGFSEGLQAATYSNYGQARRKFGDHFARPQWRSFAAALEQFLKVPNASRLWYDDRDIPFLREDLGDEAKIRQTDANTARSLVEGGWDADAAVNYVKSGNLGILVGEHSGLTSVQLNPPEDGSEDNDDSVDLGPEDSDDSED